jgi:hypothetical protein
MSGVHKAWQQKRQLTETIPQLHEALLTPSPYAPPSPETPICLLSIRCNIISRYFSRSGFAATHDRRRLRQQSLCGSSARSENFVPLNPKVSKSGYTLIRSRTTTSEERAIGQRR